MPVEFPSSPITGTTFTTTTTWTYNGSTWNTAAVPAGLVTTVDTQTLINKTISGTANTITLADGSVTNAKLASSSITINGSPVSLGGSITISALPSQTGNSGKVLTTDGTTASWAFASSSSISDILMLGGM